MLLEEIGKTPDLKEMVNLINKKKKDMESLKENIGKK